MLQLRLMERPRELVRRDEVDAPDRRHCWRHPDRIVEPACAMRAAWSFLRSGAASSRLAWDSGQTSYFRHGDTASVTLMETQSKE